MKTRAFHAGRPCMLGAMVLLLSLFTAGQRNAVADQQAQATPVRYFVSDLHLGVGRDEKTGNWLPFEDFRWHDDFVAFLGHIAAASGDRAELIVLGDFVELWQSANVDCAQDKGLVKCVVRDCAGPGPQWGCSEQEAMNRLRRVLAQHSRTLREIGSFAARGSNRVVIVPGNHDAPLLLPAAAKLLTDAMASPRGRAVVASTGRWLSEDGRVLAEHGHQFDRVNFYRKWPTPYENVKGSMLVERPWGELMVQQFYNTYEHQFPAIDNLATEAEGIRYALAALHARGVTAGVNNFFRFLVLETSLRQKIDFLGKKDEGEPPEWDLERVKQKGTDFLVTSIDTSDPAYPVMHAAFDRGELTLRPADLDNEQLEALCEKRALLAAKYQQEKRTPALEPCPVVGGAAASNLGYLADKVLKRERENLIRHLRGSAKSIEAQTKRRPAIDAYIYGHTHSATAGERFQVGLGWESFVVNTGAFQRLANAGWLKKAVTDRGLKDHEVLARIQPDDLPACYSFVRVAPYSEGQPLHVVSRRWTLKQGKWRDAETCE